MKVVIVDNYNQQRNTTNILIHVLIMFILTHLWMHMINDIHSIVSIINEFSSIWATILELIYNVIPCALIAMLTRIIVFRTDSYTLHREFGSIENILHLGKRDGLYVLGSGDNSIGFKASCMITDKVDSVTININQHSIVIAIPLLEASQYQFCNNNNRKNEAFSNVSN